MKWTLYVEPNHCFDEDFPTGWSHDAVMKAAQARYAGKVSTVAPAAIGGSDDDEPSSRSSSPSYSSSSFGESAAALGVMLGIFGIIAFWEAIVVIFLVTLVGGGSFLGFGMYLNWKEEQDKNQNHSPQVSNKYRTETIK